MYINFKIRDVKGFTLIELLVVLAVLAIIALIAVPNFMGIQEKSKINSDLGSCETIRNALQMAISSESLTLADGTEICKFSKDADIEFKVAGLQKDIVKNFLRGVEDTFRAQSEGFEATFTTQGNKVIYKAKNAKGDLN